MKKSLTSILARFVSKTGFDALPKLAVREAKRLILDTIGCALGGYATDIGKIVSSFARDIGGKPESTIIGSKNKTSCLNATYVNAKTANILDADSMFYARGGMHFSTSLLSASLAACERIKGSGRDLIKSVVVGFETAARIGLSMSFKEKERNPGASLTVTFAGMTGAAKALELDEEQLIQAFGIAAGFTPLPTKVKFYDASSDQIPHIKYADTGWCAKAGVAATLLAQKGFTGYANIFDGDCGVWRLYGANKSYSHRLVESLGKKWHITDIFYKPWPSCRVTHRAATILDKIIKENNLRPQEIETVVVRTTSARAIPFFTIQEPVGMMGYQFNIPHTLAMVAFQVKPGPMWFAKEVAEDSKVREFRKKIHVELNPRGTKLSRESVGRAHKPATSLEVIAGGRKFIVSTDYAKGDPWTPETYFTDEELKEKFREMALQSAVGQRGPREQIEKIIETVYSLEKVEKIEELTELTFFKR